MSDAQAQTGTRKDPIRVEHLDLDDFAALLVATGADGRAFCPALRPDPALGQFTKISRKEACARLEADLYERAYRWQKRLMGRKQAMIRLDNVTFVPQGFDKRSGRLDLCLPAAVLSLSGQKGGAYAGLALGSDGKPLLLAIRTGTRGRCTTPRMLHEVKPGPLRYGPAETMLSIDTNPIIAQRLLGAARSRSGTVPLVGSLTCRLSGSDRPSRQLATCTPEAFSLSSTAPDDMSGLFIWDRLSGLFNGYE